MILVLRPEALRHRSLLCWKGMELRSVGSGLGQGLSSTCGAGPGQEELPARGAAVGALEPVGTNRRVFKGRAEVAGQLGRSFCAWLNKTRLLCCFFFPCLLV